MLAGDTSILDERVLNGLKETYNSLGVPIGATVQSIQAIKEAAAALVGPAAGRDRYSKYLYKGAYSNITNVSCDARRIHW